jgi:hypothetical protein
LNSSQKVISAKKEKRNITSPNEYANQVTILSKKDPCHRCGISNKYKAYGSAKKETVPTSNNRPIRNVFAILKNEVSTSFKTQNTKMSRISVDKIIYVFTK